MQITYILYLGGSQVYKKVSRWCHCPWWGVLSSDLHFKWCSSQGTVKIITKLQFEFLEVENFEICFELLSCCSSQSLFSFIFFFDWLCHMLQECWYVLGSIHPSARAVFPVPLDATQPQRITDPPLCVKCSFHQMLLLSLQTYLWWLLSKCYIFTSSVHSTCFQKASGSSRCCFVYTRCSLCMGNVLFWWLLHV